MFIITGDGEFQIFDNPIQAICFVIKFQALVKSCLSDNFGWTKEGKRKVNEKFKYIKSLRDLISNNEIRYAITLDNIYSYNDNFYGSAIINNSRILSQDSLNRVLADSNVIDWLN